MKKSILSQLISISTMFLIVSILVLNFTTGVFAQAVYVDSKTGNDDNSGTVEAPFLTISRALEVVKSSDNDIYTIKINPGIYVLKSHAVISTTKNLTNRRIVIEASILPGESSWNPEKMPVIICEEPKGNISMYFNFVVALLVEENHVTIRGIKFHGYLYPNTRYFPIARLNEKKTDLLVKQCMFVGDKDASHIQVGVIANGDEIKIDHCVFYNAKNAIVYWLSNGSSKTGNAFTNNIVSGAFQCAVWWALPDKDFVFRNNIITNCKHAFIQNFDNKTVYSIENSVIVNNQYYQGVASNSGILAQAVAINETDIIKEGEVSLKMMNDDVDPAIPVDYLHVVSTSLGYDIGAGLFKKETSSKGTGMITLPEKPELFQNYPNPFNPSTVIGYQLPEFSNVTLKVYDTLGQEIKTLVDSYQTEGNHYVVWNGINEDSKPVSTGIYFYSLDYKKSSLHKKMILVR